MTESTSINTCESGCYNDIMTIVNMGVALE